MIRKPKLSVISIAKSKNELEPLLTALKHQTYDNFEVVTSTKGTIPEAWNDAIMKAEGDFLVFTESDARPVNENWLSEIAENVKRKSVIKGIEVRPVDFNLCNTVFDADIFKKDKFKFDENFSICEDTELFANLRKNGYDLLFVDSFPVRHEQKVSWKNTLKRAFKQGFYFAKIVKLHGLQNVDSINTQSCFIKNKSTEINPISNRIREMAHTFLVLTGGALGLMVYKFKNK